MKAISKILLIVLVLLIALAGFFFLWQPKETGGIVWGVNFSQKHATYLGTDWQKSYSAILTDLKVKKIKLASYWDLIEKEKDVYDFADLDWQIREAEKYNIEILLVIGMKTGRWPECHIPGWAKGLDKEVQQEEILELVEQLVLRYQGSEAVFAWQVENEPFFPFGECPWVDKEFLKKEIAFVKSKDNQSKPIIVSDSGEGSLWITAASFGDIAGTTMYKRVWVRQVGIYLTWPFPSAFYYLKTKLIESLFDKKVICIELQAEPWCAAGINDCSLDEQKKTMDLAQFRYNINFAKRTGIKEFYLWGAEWWYWLKEKQNDSGIWDEAKKLF